MQESDNSVGNAHRHSTDDRVTFHSHSKKQRLRHAGDVGLPHHAESNAQTV